MFTITISQAVFRIEKKTCEIVLGVWNFKCDIEVAQGVIFMEQNMRFGLILGQLTILKKKLGRL